MTELCRRCRNLDFSNPGLEINQDSGDLEQSSLQCELCSLLWDISTRLLSTQQVAKQGTLYFKRTGSLLKMVGTQHEPIPALSLTDYHGNYLHHNVQVQAKEYISQTHLQMAAFKSGYRSFLHLVLNSISKSFEDGLMIVIGFMEVAGSKVI
jgi:hypothetical protein